MRSNNQALLVLALIISCGGQHDVGPVSDSSVYGSDTIVSPDVLADAPPDGPDAGLDAGPDADPLPPVDLVDVSVACSEFAETFCPLMGWCHQNAGTGINVGKCVNTDYNYCMSVNVQDQIPEEILTGCLDALDNYVCFTGYPAACYFAEWGWYA